MVKLKEKKRGTKFLYKESLLLLKVSDVQSALTLNVWGTNSYLCKQAGSMPAQTCDSSRFRRETPK